MTDHRIQGGREEGGSPTPPLLNVLINHSEDIGRRFELIASNLPYRAVEANLHPDTVPELAQSLATATWRRVDDEVPGYAFAEELGRTFRDANASLASVLLYWQILRRAIHLVLADQKIRTGEGDPPTLREMTLMNYTLDWATEAAVVGYVMAADDVT